MKSILRRSTPERKEAKTTQIRHGQLLVDSGRREVQVDGNDVQLAPKEFDLLWELLDHNGLVLTRDQLLERVWGTRRRRHANGRCPHPSAGASLGDASPIVTVWGSGTRRPRTPPRTRSLPD